MFVVKLCVGCQNGSTVVQLFIGVLEMAEAGVAMAIEQNCNILFKSFCIAYQPCIILAIKNLLDRSQVDG